MWVKCEIMELKLIGCVCNLQIEREKLKNILDILLVGVFKFFYFYYPICLSNWRDDHNRFFIFSYLACYDHNNKTIRSLKVIKAHDISYQIHTRLSNIQPRVTISIMAVIWVLVRHGLTYTTLWIKCEPLHWFQWGEWKITCYWWSKTLNRTNLTNTT